MSEQVRHPERSVRHPERSEGSAWVRSLASLGMTNGSLRMTNADSLLLTRYCSLLTSYSFYRDLPRPRLLDLGQGHRQHPVFMGSLDLIRIDRLRQRKGPLKA